MIVYSDGAARGNPGPAGAGFVVYDSGGRLLAKDSVYLGETTNNVAEYTAFIRALTRAADLSSGPLLAYSDSELMVRQLNGEYRVREPHLVPLYEQAKALLGRFASATVAHVPREKNREADRLSNEGIDRHFSSESSR